MTKEKKKKKIDSTYLFSSKRAAASPCAATEAF